MSEENVGIRVGNLESEMGTIHTKIETILETLQKVTAKLDDKNTTNDQDGNGFQTPNSRESGSIPIVQPRRQTLAGTTMKKALEEAETFEAERARNEQEAQKLSIITRNEPTSTEEESEEQSFREAFMAAVSGINEGVANDSGNIDLRDKCQDQAVAALHDEQNAPGCYAQLFFGKAEVSIIAKCEDSVLGDEKQFRGAFATAASGADEDKTNDPVCGNLGDTCCEQSLQALHDEVSTIGIPVDFISYSNGDHEDGTGFNSEKRLNQISPEARPSAACIALSRYKVWRRKRGKYYTSS